MISSSRVYLGMITSRCWISFWIEILSIAAAERSSSLDMSAWKIESKFSSVRGEQLGGLRLALCSRGTVF